MKNTTTSPEKQQRTRRHAPRFLAAAVVVLVAAVGALTQAAPNTATGTPSVTAADGANLATTGPKEGVQLTAARGTVNDSEGVNTSSITWSWAQANSVNPLSGLSFISGAGSGNTFTPGQSNVGKYLYVCMNFRDNASPSSTEQRCWTSAAPVVDVPDGIPGAPILTKPVSADWNTEDFTLYWRPPANTGSSPITGYRIFREQNDVGFYRFSHPHACDSASFGRSLEAYAQVYTDKSEWYEFTANPSAAAGATFGNCYRWKIAAVNDAGVGPAVTTDPILARGYEHNGQTYSFDNHLNDGVACPAGQFRIYGFQGNWGIGCITPDKLGEAETCHALRDNAQRDGHASLHSAYRNISYGGRTGVCSVDPPADNATCGNFGFANLGSRPWFTDRLITQQMCGVNDPCGTLSEYNIDHRECHCQGWAEPASTADADSPNICECNVGGANANCECPSGTAYAPESHACECTTGGQVLNPSTNACEFTAETVNLFAEVAKTNPSLVSVRALLSLGASPNVVTTNAQNQIVPVLLTAAALGHSDIVSVLITAGADPAAKNGAFFDTNVAHFMAAVDGSNLTRTQKTDVLRHFIGGLDVAGAAFDWNAEDPNGNSPMKLLRTASDPGNECCTTELLNNVGAMADLMLGQGARCPAGGASDIYRHACIGNLGKALADLVNTDDGVTVYSGAEIQTAAQAMVDAGIPLSVAGVTNRAHLVGVASFTGQGPALSVLLTFGMDPDGRGVANRNVLAQVGRWSGVSDRKPVRAARVMEFFVGGLDAAGKLTGANAYAGWNATDGGFNKRPLDYFHDHITAPNNEGFDDEKDAIHELLYENGARCATPGTKKYCQIPTEDIEETTRLVGAVLTVSRPRLSIRPVVPSVDSNLTMNGWTITVDTINTNTARLVLSRTRAHQTGDGPAVFTLTMLRGSDAVRIVNISVGIEANPAYVSLVAAVTTGNAAQVSAVLNADLINAVGPNGIPLLITAAVLGHAAVVSVLLTAGYDPDTRSDWFDLNIPLLMATYDGTTQPDGTSELPRAKRLEVLRHFGDALEILGTDYDWNSDGNGVAIDGNGNNFADLLLLSEDNDGANGTEAERLAMADYALSRGTTCNPPFIGRTSTDRYRKYCIGGLGANLYNAAAATNADSAAVRAAALAMAGAGIPITIAGGVYSPITANVLGIAMHRLRQEDVGVLISLGADPNSRAGGYAAPHIAARAAESDPLDALGMLQSGFIGGMLAAGTFSQFTAWNESVGGKTPLDWMQDAVTSQSNPAFKSGLHVQLYEQGARCTSASGQYCGLPRATNIRTEPAKGTGAVLTVKSRPFSGFRSPQQVASDVLTSLTANGWGVSQQASALSNNSNPDMLLTRERPGLETDAAAIFTVTLTSAAGTDSQAIFVSATAAIESGIVSLAAAVAAGDLAETRFWLATLGTRAVDAKSRDDPPVPLLIVAATAGYSDVLSVLVTFGMDVNAQHPDSQTYYNHTVPFLMSDFENPLALSRTERLEVIRHFGDAVKLRGANYNWNAADISGYRLPNLLQFSHATSDAAQRAVLLETADYFLAQGMSCKSQTTLANRYSRYCVGGLGGVLVSLLTAASAASDSEVRAAAQAMVDAGITLEAAGDPMNGHLVPVAAFNRHANAVSILITFGMNPTGKRGNDAVPHVVAQQSTDHPAAMLNVLRAYIGGLSAAGKLQGFNWNLRSVSDTALDLLDDVAVEAENEPPDKDKIHSLLYELGGRCQAGSLNDFCDIPTDDFALPLVSGTGAFFTLTARAFSDFQSPPMAAAVSAELEASGWGHALNTVANPDELELNRVRFASPSDLPAVFTVTLVSGAGASREMRVWATVSQGEIPQPYYDLVTAILEGNADDAKAALEAGSVLTDSSDENGVPLLIVAATLGHPEVVEVLISAGFNPGARRGGETALDLMRDLYEDADEEKRNDYDEIADSLLSRGVSCSGGIEARFDPPCIGSSGAALVALITMTTPIADDQVRAAAQAVVDAGVSLDFVGADGKGELVAVGAANGHASAVSILLTFGMNAVGRGGGSGGSGRTEWTALHHIADSVRGNATVALESLRLFIGGLSVAGKLGSFAGWNLTAGSDARPLDVFDAAATLSSDSEVEKVEMQGLFIQYGAECETAEGKQYCGLPREEHSFLNVSETGPVVTLVGTGAGAEMFVLPEHSRTVELYEAGWILRLNATVVPPEVVLLRDAAGNLDEEAVAITLSLLSDGRIIREYRITARAEFFFDCAAVNKKEPFGGSGGCGSCLDDSTEIGGDCVRRDGDFRRSSHRTVCEDYLGGRVVRNVVCQGIDKDGTFCIMDSRDAFPCRGLFRHILRCNLTYNRPGLNPFACAESCGDPTVDEIARGAGCGG